MLKQIPCLIYLFVSNLKNIRSSINICRSKSNHIACHFILDALIQMVESFLSSRVNNQSKDVHTGRSILRPAIPSLSINLSLQQSGQKLYKKMMKTIRYFLGSEGKKNYTVQEGRKCSFGLLLSSNGQSLHQFLSCLFSHPYWLHRLH